MDMVENIYALIKAIDIPKEGQYSLLSINSDGIDIYYGKNVDGHSVFATISQNGQLRVSMQKTKKLIFLFNAMCDVAVDGVHSETTMNVLTCLSDDENEILAFIRLTLAFVGGSDEQSPKRMHELFTSLTNLFASIHKANQIELQGFFGELYAIRYFYQFGLNLSDFWQKKEKMKFDISISSQKKIEIKTTTKDLRIHHFRHEQLLSDLYDICVISIMLRVDDQGLSLLDLVSDVQKISASNFETLIYIENFIRNIDDAELGSMRFDEGYLDRNLHVYKTESIPRFEDEQPRGVSKAEYDSDLTNSTHTGINDFIEWVQQI